MAIYFADEEYHHDGISVRWAIDHHGERVLAVVKEGRVVASGGKSSPDSVEISPEDQEVVGT